jgi:hypothetical protein
MKVMSELGLIVAGGLIGAVVPALGGLLAFMRFSGRLEEKVDGLRRDFERFDERLIRIEENLTEFGERLAKLEAHA